MALLTRVVWREGMHLAQHHFQSQARYFESLYRFTLSNLFPGSFGFAGVELEEESLLNGTAALVHARGLMPDGLSFNFPEDDPLPEPRRIDDMFGPTENVQRLLLAIPAFQVGKGILGAPEGDQGGPERYSPREQPVWDELTGRDEKPLTFAKKNFCLLLEKEMHPGMVSMPIGRIKRGGGGRFVYDRDYVPPCLQIGASPRLLEIVRKVVVMLEEKSEELLARRGPSHPAQLVGSSGDLVEFWLVHTLFSSLGLLRHHLQTKHTHPESLFLDLSRLAGSLCTFSLTEKPGNLPAYHHEEPGESFSLVAEHIRRIVETAIPDNLVRIPLSRPEEFLYVGDIQDERCFGPSRWVLGVRSTLPEADLITSVPNLVKVCSGKYIMRVVLEARTALGLEHLKAPSGALRPKEGTQYFLIEQNGPCWKAILRGKDVGVYVPEALPDDEVELFVLIDQS